MGAIDKECERGEEGGGGDDEGERSTLDGGRGKTEREVDEWDNEDL
jgi:hypothetical protein